MTNVVSPDPTNRFAEVPTTLSIRFSARQSSYLNSTLPYRFRRPNPDGKYSGLRRRGASLLSVQPGICNALQKNADNSLQAADIQQCRTLSICYFEESCSKIRAQCPTRIPAICCIPVPDRNRQVSPTRIHYSWAARNSPSAR